MAVTDATNRQTVFIVSTCGGHHAWIGVGDKRCKTPIVSQVENGSRVTFEWQFKPAAGLAVC